MPLQLRVADALTALGIEYEVMACDPDLADTAAFCEAYGVDPADSANTILVASRRPEGVVAACVALATTRLDVNHRVRDLMGVKKLSFASAQVTEELTGMLIGGVTPFGLPAGMAVYVDRAVMDRSEIVLGGGNRESKLRIRPEALGRIPAGTIVPDLAESITA